MSNTVSNTVSNTSGLRHALSPVPPHDLIRFADTIGTVDAGHVPDPAVKAVSDQIRAMIRSGQLSPFSAIEIIRAATNIGADLDAVESIIEEIAKGADGIGGTADDLIPVSTVEILRTLLHSGVVRDVVSWVADLLSPAKQDTQHPPQKWVDRVKTAVTGCFGSR